MKLRKTQRSKAKIKIGIKGPSGSGKTYSSLLLAKGLAKEDFSKVAIICSENKSADLYFHLGNYNVLSLEPPFTPEKYIEAIEVCEKANMEVIIIDSISHCWSYLLSFHASLKGNSFVNWSKVSAKQNQFINRILQSNTHIIATMRTKHSYVLNLKDGKYIPEKIGLKAIQRDDVEFEFSLVFDIDSKHLAISTKDRTSLFVDKKPFVMNVSTGTKLLNWCNNTTTEAEVITEINKCTEVTILSKLYSDNPSFQKRLNPLFIKRKEQLLNTQKQV